VQSKDLKWEPYDTKVQEEVNKQWEILQEEAADRKRLRVVTRANNAATEARKDMEKRLEVLEAFARKCEPQFEKWQRTKLQLAGSDEPQSGDENEDNKEELAIMSIGHDPTNTKEDAEHISLHGSDDEDSSEKSKSLRDEEEEDSDEENSSMNGEQPIHA